MFFSFVDLKLVFVFLPAISCDSLTTMICIVDLFGVGGFQNHFFLLKVNESLIGEVNFHIECMGQMGLFLQIAHCVEMYQWLHLFIYIFGDYKKESFLLDFFNDEISRYNASVS